MRNPTSGELSERELPKTILVVDDDHAIRRGLRRVLMREGYQVIDAQNGHEAVRVFQEHPCHLALLDMNMPLLNGWGTIAKLRLLQSGLPAIFVTARPDQQNIAHEAGIDLMEKPINLALLLSRIGSLLGTR
jgi:DNA-binding response OmpR family regulator